MSEETIKVEIVNPSKEGKFIYKDQTNALQISLINDGVVNLPSAKKEGKLTISVVFKKERLVEKKLTIDKPDGLTVGDIDDEVGGEFLTLLLYPPENEVWKAGDKKLFSIDNIQNKFEIKNEEKGFPIEIIVGYEDGDFELVEELYSHVHNVPVQSSPNPKNKDISEVLDVFLENQGQIFVSPHVSDPIFNELTLVVKNKGTGSLFEGHSDITPTISVEFVYGETIGSLAPAPTEEEKKMSIGSAWGFKPGAVNSSVRTKWIADPGPIITKHPSKNKDKEVSFPKWIFRSEGINKKGLGTGAEATVTFSLNQIVSLTPPGHTQMMVTFKNFENDNIRYNDEVFMLDIVKENPPLNRGVTNFFCPEPEIKVVSKKYGSPKVNLKWNGFKVDKVDILTHYPNVPKYSWSRENESNGTSRSVKDIPSYDKVFDYKTATIELPMVKEMGTISFTIIARGKNGAFLNSKQCMAFVSPDLFYDSKTGLSYDTMKVGERLWMTEDLTVGKEKLHDFETAMLHANDGWRLPTKEEWEADFIQPQAVSIAEFHNKYSEKPHEYRPPGIGSSGSPAPIGPGGFGAGPQPPGGPRGGFGPQPPAGPTSRPSAIFRNLNPSVYRFGPTLLGRKSSSGGKIDEKKNSYFWSGEETKDVGRYVSVKPDKHDMNNYSIAYESAPLKKENKLAVRFVKDLTINEQNGKTGAEKNYISVNKVICKEIEFERILLHKWVGTLVQNQYPFSCDEVNRGYRRVHLRTSSGIDYVLDIGGKEVREIHNNQLLKKFEILEYYG